MITQVTIGRDGESVLLKWHDGRVLQMPWDAAVQVGKALIQKGHEVEEEIKAESIARDEGLLLRLGIPIGLTSNAAIIREARKEAVWGDIRRYVPLIGSGESVGTPTLRKHNNGG